MNDINGICHDYLKVAQFIEILKEKELRVIVMKDNVCSFYFGPFRNNG